MNLKQRPKGHRFPMEIISYCVWSYHRFNDSYRDVAERLALRGLQVSHQSIRNGCVKFANHFASVIKKRERKPTDKWYLDEMIIKINGDPFILWRAVDSNGHELDILLQKRKNKKAAMRFLSKLLGTYAASRVMVTDKLRSYKKPIKNMCPDTEHRSHKRLNNRVENTHQPTRRKEKCLVKFKSPVGVQQVMRLMGRTRNIFSISVGRYTNTTAQKRCQFNQAKAIWNEVATQLLCA